MKGQHSKKNKIKSTMRKSLHCPVTDVGVSGPVYHVRMRKSRGQISHLFPDYVVHVILINGIIS